jgi:nucleotide-binding universal stress UspA family protein
MSTLTLSRFAAGVDGFEEGADAAALAATLAAATGGELMLVTVIADPTLLPPVGLKWRELRDQAQATVTGLRDELWPGARTVIETDFSVARGLQRVITLEHRDVLVVGSHRDRPAGEVTIGRTTRQLLGHLTCPLVIAPRGYRGGERRPIRVIGVGYDGSQEADAALAAAASLARRTEARLEIRAVIDDWIPSFGLSGPRGARVIADWGELVADDVAHLRGQADEAAARHGATDVTVAAVSGAPSEILLAFAASVDLIVIGSRRWGAFARVLLGSTGEALVNGSRCPVLVAPRVGGRGQPPA